MAGRRKQLAFEKWKVLITTTLIQSIVCGIIESYGALFVPMMKTIFPNDEKKTVKAALIGSLASGILMGFSPISSWLAERMGPLIVAVMGGVIIFYATFCASFSQSFVMMALTYGVFLGIGCSLLFISNSIIISQHFGENSTVAFGLLGFGNGVVVSIMPHIMAYAIDRINLYGAIRTICLILVPIMFLPFYWKELDFDVDKQEEIYKAELELKMANLKNRNQANNIFKRMRKNQRKKENRFSDVNMWESDFYEDDMVALRPIQNTSNVFPEEYKHRKSLSSSFGFLSSKKTTTEATSEFDFRVYFEAFDNKGYLNLCISMVVACLGYQVPNVHIVNYSNDLSLAGNPQVLLTCLGAASALGPLINPLFVDKFEEHISKFRIFQIFVLGYGISVICLPMVNNFNVLMLTCSTIGYFDGSISTLVGPLIIELMGTEKAGNAMGIYYGCIAFSVTIAAPLAGYIFELGKNYRTPFFVAGLFFLGGGFMLSFNHKQSKIEEGAEMQSAESYTKEVTGPFERTKTL